MIYQKSLIVPPITDRGNHKGVIVMIMIPEEDDVLAEDTELVRIELTEEETIMHLIASAFGNAYNEDEEEKVVKA